MLYWWLTFYRHRYYSPVCTFLLSATQTEKLSNFYWLPSLLWVLRALSVYTWLELLHYHYGKNLNDDFLLISSHVYFFITKLTAFCIHVCPTLHCISNEAAPPVITSVIPAVIPGWSPLMLYTNDYYITTGLATKKWLLSC